MSKHSRERVIERYNLELSENDEKIILNYINYGHCLPIPQVEDNLNKSCKFAYVKYKKIPIKVLYSCTNKGTPINIITAYPLDVEEYNELINQKLQKEIENCIKFLKLNNYIVYKRGENDKNNG